MGLGWGVVLCLEEKGVGERDTSEREREGHREREGDEGEFMGDGARPYILYMHPHAGGVLR